MVLIFRLSAEPDMGQTTIAQATEKKKKTSHE